MTTIGRKGHRHALSAPNLPVHEMLASAHQRERNPARVADALCHFFFGSICVKWQWRASIVVRGVEAVAKTLPPVIAVDLVVIIQNAVQIFCVGVAFSRQVDFDQKMFLVLLLRIFVENVGSELVTRCWPRFEL